MSYRCGICGEMTYTARGMAEHILGTTNRAEEHRQWINGHGLAPADAGQAPDEALVNLVERECRRQEIRRG